MAVLTTAGTYKYFSEQPKEFRSTTAIFVQQPALESAPFGGGFSLGDDRMIANQASLLRNAAVVRAEARQPEFRGEKPQSLTATPRGGQDFIDISVTDTDPQKAAQLADAFAAAFISNRSWELRAKVIRARKAAGKELAETSASPANGVTRDNLSQRVRQPQTVESLPSGNAEQIDRAAPGGQVAPKPKRNAIFAALMCGVHIRPPGDPPRHREPSPCTPGPIARSRPFVSGVLAYWCFARRHQYASASASARRNAY